jgi:hypothetical protein
MRHYPHRPLALSLLAIASCGSVCGGLVITKTLVPIALLAAPHREKLRLVIVDARLAGGFLGLFGDRCRLDGALRLLACDIQVP